MRPASLLNATCLCKFLYNLSYAQPCLLSQLAAAECYLVCTSGTCSWFARPASSLLNTAPPCSCRFT